MKLDRRSVYSYNKQWSATSKIAKGKNKKKLRPWNDRTNERDLMVQQADNIFLLRTI